MEPSLIQLDQICHISSIIETGEEIKYQARLDMDWIAYFNNFVHSSCSEDSLDGKNGGSINKVSTSQFT